MSSGIVSLAINIVIAALLAVTIAYCWALNRRIKILQDSKSELAQLLAHFDESTQRAAESIIALQTASKKIGDNIQMRIDKANYLLDDLAFMIEKGSKLADSMEAGIAVDRARKRVIAEQPAATITPEPEEEEKIELAPPKAAASTKPQLSSRERTAASLEALLERVVGRNSRPPQQKPMDEESAAARQRSRSEQELLEMLRTGIKG